jgi:hypothetical protein
MCEYRPARPIIGKACWAGLGPKSMQEAQIQADPHPAATYSDDLGTGDRLRALLEELVIRPRTLQMDAGTEKWGKTRC